MNDLCRLLEDLQRSSRPAAVTVVDNSPTDALRPVVEDYGASYVASPSNVGFGRAHNLAMKRAIQSSRYHIVCNPDIRCAPDVLEELQAFMEAQPEIGLVMPRVLYPDGREQRLCKMLPTPVDLLVRRFLGPLGERLARRSGDRYQLRHVDLRVAREIPSLSGCFMFLRSSVLREVGLFDPRYFLYMEDVDLCRRIGAVAQTVFYPAVSVTHGYAKGSYKSRKLMLHHVVSAARYFSKWGWMFDQGRRLLNARTEVLEDTGARVLTAGTYAGTR